MDVVGVAALTHLELGFELQTAPNGLGLSIAVSLALIGICLL